MPSIDVMAPGGPGMEVIEEPHAPPPPVIGIIYPPPEVRSILYYLHTVSFILQSNYYDMKMKIADTSTTNLTSHKTTF